MAIRATDKPPQGDWPPQGQWTYADYKRLPEDGWRYEVIDGDLLTTPAPKTIHQKSLTNLGTALVNHVKEKGLGEVYCSPIDVVMGNRATPVQPDLVYIARDRLHIVTEDFIDGPPDLVVEILSPSNWIVDRRDKFRIYALAGVREYWIVDAAARTIEVFALHGGAFARLSKSGPDDKAMSEVLAGFSIEVSEVCPA